MRDRVLVLLPFPTMTQPSTSIECTRPEVGYSRMLLFFAWVIRLGYGYEICCLA